MPDLGGLRDRVDGALGRHRAEVAVNAIGSMFTVFFAAGPIDTTDAAARADRARFARFHAALLDSGVYFPPSQFEAAFVSAAHGAREIDATIAAADTAFRAAFEGA